MRMRRTTGAILVLLGAVLMGAALLLYMHNKQEDEEAGEASRAIMQTMRSSVDDEIVPVRRPVPEEAEKEMKVFPIDGYDYMGWLTMPTVDLELPIMAEWDYERLKIAPCRQFGSIESNDLVIAAHHFENHFGYLGNLQIDDEVFFTDVEGNEIAYVVRDTTELQETDTGAIENTPYDLILYTCTFDLVRRTTIFLERVP
ncbi:MAG: sortase [Tissierellia bacterium]|jgi:sortase A|nr:sortase [Tissierellia bacterium]